MESGFGSDFGSDFGSGAGGGGKLDPGLIMEQVKVQIAVANAQELLQCIGKPGGALDNSEQVRGALRGAAGRCGALRGAAGGRPRGSPRSRLRVPQKCIAMCMDRYMDAWNAVSRAYNSRLQRERANM
uniref:Mitochondrial import inner membrane translocase subunit n=1 Tax=Phasianus colchicus TaxID=9054 RepID=A0A669Q721_PHACC